MFFLVRYCKSLEEGSFRNRSADFLYMLLLGRCLASVCSLSQVAHAFKCLL